MEGRRDNIGRQIDQRETAHVRIDRGLRNIVKTDASRNEETIRERVERYIYEGLERDSVQI